MNRKERFLELTRPWRDRLYGMALRHARHRETAEDWVQETLLRAWRDFSNLSDAQAVYSWLLKILDHVMADDLRRTQRRQQLAPVVTTEDSRLLEHPSAAPGPFEELLRQQTGEQLEQAILALPENFSRVVMLRDLEGLSYAQIAQLLEIPQGTVMSRLSRGRRILASRLLQEARRETLFGENRHD